MKKNFIIVLVSILIIIYVLGFLIHRRTDKKEVELQKQNDGKINVIVTPLPTKTNYSIQEIKTKLQNIDTSDTVKINEEKLKNNFFTSSIDPQHKWLSVAGSETGYANQYYSRDTFVTFIGGIEGDQELRETLAYGIDWFGKNITKQGNIPLWFRETDQLNVYYYVPYDRTEKTGGIIGLDYQMQFIDAIYLYFKKTQNKEWLKQHIDYARSVRKYLLNRTDDYLLVGDYSKYGGNDWAEQVFRSGKSLFVNAYWYKVNSDLIELEQALGNIKESKSLKSYNNLVKQEFNKKFWTYSQPISCPFGKFGHYLAWKNKYGTFDYFELDGNMLAVEVGLSDDNQSQSIMKIVDKNFDYFVDQYGATRVLCGYYDSKVTTVKPDTQQNGTYWYIPSYYLTMALAKTNNVSRVIDLYDRVTHATKKFQKEGLAEWYYKDGSIGGATNYSWSMAYPLYLSSVINSFKRNLR